MVRQTNLNNCYPQGITGNGIFSDLQKLDVPWKDKNMSLSLDISYFGIHSGQKTISPFIENFITDDSEVISDLNRDIIAKCLFDVYGDQWKHLWDTTQQEYNMLWNTDATIETDTSNTGSDNRTSSENNTGTDTHTLSGTDTTTKDLTDTNTISGTDTDTTNISGSPTTTETGTIKNDNNEITYTHQKTIQMHPSDRNTSTTTNRAAGYNENDFANDTQTTVKDETAILTHTYTDNTTENPYDDSNDKSKAWKNSTDTDSTLSETRDLKTTQTLNETDEVTHNYGKTDTETIKGTDSSTSYGKTDTETVNLATSSTETGGNTFTGKETVRRTGNIGITTNQQMIQAERDLWKWNFFSQIFEDVDRYLTLAVY